MKREYRSYYLIYSSHDLVKVVGTTVFFCMPMPFVNFKVSLALQIKIRIVNVYCLTCNQKTTGSQYLVYCINQTKRLMEKLKRQEGWLSPTERASIYSFCNQPKAHFGLPWLAPGYAPGTIALNVT